MTASEQIDAALARADAAMISRSVDDLAMAAMSLSGMLDHAAKAENCVEIIRSVLKMVNEELNVQRNG